LGAGVGFYREFAARAVHSIGFYLVFAAYAATTRTIPDKSEAPRSLSPGGLAVHSGQIARSISVREVVNCSAVRELPSEPFTRQAALGSGWSDSALARAVRSGRLVRLRAGHFVAAETSIPQETLQAAAVTASVSAAVVSHRSALLAYELPIVGGLPGCPS
jgi:hypothetical protein